MQPWLCSGMSPRPVLVSEEGTLATHLLMTGPQGPWRSVRILSQVPEGIQPSCLMLSTECHGLAFPEHLKWYESCTLLDRVEKIVTASFSQFCGPDEEAWLRKASSQLIEDSETPRDRRLAQGRTASRSQSFLTIAQYLLFPCSDLVSLEEALVQSDGPVPPQHAVHGMCMGTHARAHTHKLLSLKGKDTPGSIALGKQVVLSSHLVHPLPNWELCFITCKWRS